MTGLNFEQRASVTRYKELAQVDAYTETLRISYELARFQVISGAESSFDALDGNDAHTGKQKPHSRHINVRIFPWGSRS